MKWYERFIPLKHLYCLGLYCILELENIKFSEKTGEIKNAVIMQPKRGIIFIKTGKLQNKKYDKFDCKEIFDLIFLLINSKNSKGSF